ncbi:MAG: response regulator [Gammaproteobacteria bacterium]
MIRNKRSIKNRLFFILVLASTIVLLIAGLLFIAFRTVQMKQDMNNSLTIQAGVISDNAQASIVFEDKDEAHKLLSSLKYDKQIIYALLLNDRKKVLAYYQRFDGTHDISIEVWNFDDFLAERSVFSKTEHYLVYARPIYSQGNKIGYVVLYADYSRYWQLLNHSTFVVAIVIVIALFVALFVSYLLQRLISEPIESLAEFVSIVTEGQNYELRTVNESYAEIEQLATAFNMLLEQIHHAISARDQAQSQLKKYSLQLQDLVYQRTRQLEAAKEAAEASSKAKSAFLANMSHEIRTPMNSIVVFTKLALVDSASPHQRQQLKHALESADLLMALIDDLLDFSRIDANKMELDYQNCNLFEILTSINQMLTVKFVEKGLEFIIDVSETVPRYIQIDSLRLKQVLINLLTNALKFTESGQVRLTIAASATSPSMNQVTFSISDTGIGMDQQTISRIFEVFSQGDVSTTRKYGGTGLGLSISKKLVTMMGGSLNVDSQPGKGSRFSFTLSLKSTLLDDAKGKISWSSATPTVMLVEPHQQSREHLIKLLKSLKCAVDSPETGNQALALLKQQPYSHALISRHLPDIEAFDLIRRIKSIPHTAKLSITLMDSLLGEQAIKHFSETVTPIGYLKTPVFDTMLLYRQLIPPDHQESKKLSSPTAKRPRQINGLSSVLIVDDYDINRLLIKDILQDMTKRFLEAANGREAITILQQESVDLVLMDIQMPEMDGFEATQRIRSELQLTDLPIIGMTAFAAEHDCLQCYQAGMNDVLTKPIDIDQLMKIFKLYSKGVPKLPIVSNPAREELLTFPLPGVDVPSGLSRLRNNAETYKKLLILFHQNYQGKDNELGNHLAQKNWDAALAWLHDLKGISANLSISSLTDSCNKLHDQLKNKVIDPEDYKQFKYRFNEVIQGLQHLVSTKSVSAPATKSIDLPKLQPLLVELAEAIDKQSFSCHHILANIGTICEGHFSQTLDGLDSYLQNFQYKQAARILKQWQDEIDEQAKSRQI